MLIGVICKGSGGRYHEVPMFYQISDWDAKGELR